MTAPGLDEQPFRFFDLPPELRDWVYDYLLGEEKAIDKNPTCSPEIEYSPNVTVQGYALLRVLLASRRLKEEYQSRIKGLTTIVLTDFEDCDLAISKLSTPAALVTRLHLRIIAQCSCNACLRAQPTIPLDECALHNDLDSASGLIDDALAQAPRCTALTVDIGCWRNSGGKYRWFNREYAEIFHERLTKQPHEPLSSISVYTMTPKSYDARAIAEGALEAIWTRKDGWKAEIPDDKGQAANDDQQTTNNSAKEQGRNESQQTLEHNEQPAEEVEQSA